MRTRGQYSEKEKSLADNSMIANLLKEKKSDKNALLDREMKHFALVASIEKKITKRKKEASIGIRS